MPSCSVFCCKKKSETSNLVKDGVTFHLDTLARSPHAYSIDPKQAQQKYDPCTSADQDEIIAKPIVLEQSSEMSQILKRLLTEAATSRFSKDLRLNEGSQNMNMETDHKCNDDLSTKRITEGCFTDYGSHISLNHDSAPTVNIASTKTEPSEGDDVPQVCRICLATDIKMYHISKYKLDQMYEEITGMLTADDRLPQHICWECTARLSQAVTLRNKALQTDAILQNILEREDIKILDIKTVDRKANGLDSCLGNSEVLIDFVSDIEVKTEKTYDVNVIYNDADNLDTQEDNTDIQEEYLNTNKEEEILIPPNLAETNEVNTLEIDLEEIKTEIDNTLESESTEFVDRYNEDNNILDEIGEMTYNPNESNSENDIDSEISNSSEDRNVKIGRKETQKSAVKRKSEDIDTTISKRARVAEKSVDSLDSFFKITPFTKEQEIEKINKRKESAMYLNAPYKCDICYTGFKNSDGYNKHKQIHSEKNGSYECEICKRRLKSKRSLHQHIRSNHTRQYDCKKCKFTTKSRVIANIHIKRHEDCSIICKQCNMMFSEQSTYEDHKFKTGPMQCTCGEKFDCKRGIVKHMKTTGHTKMKVEGTYCDLCNLNFLTPALLQEHMTTQVHTRKAKKKRRGVAETEVSKFIKSLFTITVRPIEQQIEEVAKRKESDSYSKAPYKCHLCYRWYWNLGPYTTHIARHSEDSGPHECVVCKYRLKTETALKTHAKMHNRQYECKKCSLITTHINTAYNHYKWHEGILFQCQHCHQEFKQMSTYKNHLRLKHGSAVCRQCGLTFVNNETLSRHQLSKHKKGTGLRSTHCDVCDVNFASKKAYDEHIKTFPNHIRKNRICPTICELCGTVFNKESSYKSHYTRAHLRERNLKRPCVCEICGKAFVEQLSLSSHMCSAHNKEKPYQCDYCQKKFALKARLVIHIKNIHMQEKYRGNFQCPVCNRIFSYYSNMRRHMLIHDANRSNRYKCNLCDKGFSSPDSLRSHTQHIHMKKPWPRRPNRYKKVVETEENVQ